MKERLPILLWGDLVKRGRPVLRRALAGDAAHEAMYAWVYLTEYMALRRLKDGLADKDLWRLTEPLFNDFDEVIWQVFDRARIDPHFQTNKDAFEAMAYLIALCAAQREPTPVFVELGSTFFAAIEKFDILDLVTRNTTPNWPTMIPQWIGIENSFFSNDTARVLHPGRDIRVVDDWTRFTRDERLTLFYSRFVASYAFPDTEAFAHFLVTNCDGAVIEDPYSTTKHDVAIFNHGQSETFFSFPALARSLEQAGFKIFILNRYPDFPKDAAPCHVIRYVAMKENTDRSACIETLRKLGWQGNLFDHAVNAETILVELNAGVSRADWAQVKRQKAMSPVWGPSILTQRPSIADRVKSGLDKLKRKLLIRHEGWGRTRLAGAMIDTEILKHSKK